MSHVWGKKKVFRGLDAFVYGSQKEKKVLGRREAGWESRFLGEGGGRGGGTLPKTKKGITYLQPRKRNLPAGETQRRIAVQGTYSKGKRAFTDKQVVGRTRTAALRKPEENILTAFKEKDTHT